MDTTTKTKRAPGPKISKFPTASSSPYTVELYGKYVVPKEDHQTMFKEDGTMCGVYEIPKGSIRACDTAKYSKLFKNSSKAIANLSDTALKLFMYIHEHLEINSDVICIIREEYLAYYGYAPNNKYAYYQAIEGLLKAEIITKKAGSTVCYWVNPNVIFNGDRTKLKNTVVHPPSTPFTGMDNHKKDNI